MSEPDVLPDSRLTHRPDLGTVMVDWPLDDGRTVRLEAQPIYCANCGKFFGHVPRDNCTFAFWLCDPCFEKHGPPSGTWVSSDHDFRTRVQQEMLDRFGRVLTDAEVARLAADGRLGPLGLLLRETPFVESNLDLGKGR